MAKTSGSNKKHGGFKVGDANYTGSITNIESLVNIKDPAVYSEVKSAISRYESVIGVDQRNIKLATLSGAIGVHVSDGNGDSQAIYLNKKVFNEKKAKIIADKKQAYTSGWLTKTNKPIAHTVTHELAHATWTNHRRDAKAVGAGKEIRKLYNDYLKKSYRKGYGKYSKANINEFFAEVVTKAVHGNADKWTKATKSIIKKYNL